MRLVAVRRLPLLGRLLRVEQVSVPVVRVMPCQSLPERDQGCTVRLAEAAVGRVRLSLQMGRPSKLLQPGVVEGPAEVRTTLAQQVALRLLEIGLPVRVSRMLRWKVRQGKTARTAPHISGTVERVGEPAAEALVEPPTVAPIRLPGRPEPPRQADWVARGVTKTPAQAVEVAAGCSVEVVAEVPRTRGVTIAAAAPEAPAPPRPTVLRGSPALHRFRTGPIQGTQRWAIPMAAALGMSAWGVTPTKRRETLERLAVTAL